MKFDLRGVLFFNAPEHVLQNIQAYTTDELCMVGALVVSQAVARGGTMLDLETSIFHAETM